MPTKVIFDNSTLADAVNKANKIAPSKGPAFDRAGGILFEIYISTKTAIVKATDLEVTFMQEIPFLEGQGNDVVWRIPSVLLSDLVGQLKMGADNVIEFIDRGDSHLRLKSNRLVARINTMTPDDYPQNFNRFPSEGMIAATQLGSRVEQVAWAVDSKSQILSGVHIDGKRLIGCSTHSIATIDCEVGVENPVTVPLSSVAVLLKNGSNVYCRAVEKRFEILLDNETRATTTVIGQPFPKIDSVLRTDFIGKVITHKQSFIDTLSSIMVLIRQERLPRLEMEINGAGLLKMITFDMEVPDHGRMQNALDVSTDFDGIFNIHFAPKMILDAVSNSRADQITIEFGHPDPEKASYSSMRFSDDLGYQCYVMPKKPDTEKEGK